MCVCVCARVSCTVLRSNCTHGHGDDADEAKDVSCRRRRK